VPPAESVFFEEGDELWDLMGAIAIERWVPDDPAKRGKRDPGKRVQGTFAGEWLVWNARSKRVVGRGSWVELKAIDRQLVDRQVRSTVAIEKNGRVEGTIVTVCGSGERAEGQEGKLMAKVAPNLFWYQRLTDLSYEVKFDRGDGRITEVKSDASIPLGKGISLAEWQENGDHYELSGTFEPVSEDGVSMRLVRQREVNGKADDLEEIGIDYDAFDGRTLKNGLQVGVFSVPPDFTYGTMKKRPRSVFSFPRELEELSSGLYEDASNPLEANGVKFDSIGSMALWDQSSAALIAINDPVNLAIIEAIVESVQDLAPAQVRCKMKWGGQSGELLMWSGGKGTIRHLRSEVIETDLGIALNVASDDREVELSFSLKVPGQGVSLSSSATMLDGESLLVGEFGKEGEVLGVTIECEVICEVICDEG